MLMGGAEPRGKRGGGGRSGKSEPYRTEGGEPLFIWGKFTMAQRVARKFTVRGEVQGVGYRFFAQRAAARHQVVGYVSNMPDGSVEALAEGSAASVEAFKHDLAAGPQWAVVQQVEEIVLEPSGRYVSFLIER